MRDHDWPQVREIPAPRRRKRGYGAADLVAMALTFAAMLALTAAMAAGWVH